MKYEKAFVAFGWMRKVPLPPPWQWGPLWQTCVQKINAGSHRCIVCPCDQGGIFPYYLVSEWTAADGAEYFHFARYSTREVPELVVRRFSPRTLVSSLLTSLCRSVCCVSYMWFSTPCSTHCMDDCKLAVHLRYCMCPPSTSRRPTG